MLASKYSSDAKTFINFVDDLRKIGIEHDVDIPQIAVMGDQSSGKSSVLEALSGIPFPRGSGCVTRCATEICMTSGEKWSAHVSVGNEKPTIVSSNSELTQIIDKKTEEVCGKDTFSNTPIHIKLTSPSAPDLTIIDLPGIVRTVVDSGESKDIESINGLIDTYMQKKRTIILAVIPCTADIATSEILTRASRVDPLGERTIGVLTKPDLIPDGTAYQWEQVLANETKKLHHGYFCVRNRSHKELTDEINVEAARENERKFFQNRFQDFEGRTGIQNLTSKLTELLVSHIHESIPAMFKELRNLKEQCMENLGKIGDAPPTEPRECRKELSQIIASLNSQITKTCIESSPVLREFNEMLDSFQTQIISCRLGGGVFCELRFTDCSHNTEIKCKCIVPASALRNDMYDGYGTIFGEIVTGNTVQIHDFCKVTNLMWKKKKDKDKQWSDYTSSNISLDKCGKVKISHDKCGNSPVNYNHEAYELWEVKAVYSNGIAKEVEEALEVPSGRELPGFPDPKIASGIISSHIDVWRSPTCTIEAELINALNEFMSAVSEDIKYKTLRAKCIAVLQSVVHQQSLMCLKEMDSIFEREMTPSTLNHYYMDTVTKMRQKRIMAIVKKTFKDNGKYSAGKVIGAFQSLVNNMGNASNKSQEIDEVTDKICAYWKTAEKRFVDNVKQELDRTMLQRLPERVEEALRNIACVSDAEICPLFEVSKRQMEKRARLVVKNARIEAALAKFKYFSEQA